MTSQSVPSHSPALPMTHTKGRDGTIRESKICLHPSQQKSGLWTQGLNAYSRMKDDCLREGPESSRICCPLTHWLEGLSTLNSVLSTDSHRAHPHCVWQLVGLGIFGVSCPLPLIFTRSLVPVALTYFHQILGSFL